MKPNEIDKIRGLGVQGLPGITSLFSLFWLGICYPSSNRWQFVQFRKLTWGKTISNIRFVALSFFPKVSEFKGAFSFIHTKRKKLPVMDLAIQIKGLILELQLVGKNIF